MGRAANHHRNHHPLVLVLARAPAAAAAAPSSRRTPAPHCSCARPPRRGRRRRPDKARRHRPRRLPLPCRHISHRLRPQTLGAQDRVGAAPHDSGRRCRPPDPVHRTFVPAPRARRSEHQLALVARSAMAPRGHDAGSRCSTRCRPCRGGFARAPGAPGGVGECSVEGSWGAGT